MKIAHIVCVFPPYRGGIGKSALDFSLLMSEKGHEVTVFTPDYKSHENSEKEKEVSQKNFKVILIKPFLKIGNGAFIPSLFFNLKKFDLLYLHYPFFGGAEIVWLFKLFNPRVKLITHYHMDIIGLSLTRKILSFPSKLIERSLLNMSDIITGASIDYIENSQIKKYYKNNKEKFRETNFPVDLARFYPENNKKNNIKKTILFVGGLDRAHYFKGLNILIQSLSLIKHRKDWELKIIGDGDLKQKYIKTVEKSGLRKQVIFLGSVTERNLPVLFREANLFVLPSINKGEAFGIVLLEAMASGLPLIASNLPGVRSVFSDREGFVVEPGDKLDLKNKIEFLLDRPGTVNQMSLNSRKLVENKYSNKKISDTLEEILNEIK